MASSETSAHRTECWHAAPVDRSAPSLALVRRISPTSPRLIARVSVLVDWWAQSTDHRWQGRSIRKQSNRLPDNAAHGSPAPFPPHPRRGPVHRAPRGLPACAVLLRCELQGLQAAPECGTCRGGSAGSKSPPEDIARRVQNRLRQCPVRRCAHAPTDKSCRACQNQVVTCKAPAL